MLRLPRGGGRVEVTVRDRNAPYGTRPRGGDVRCRAHAPERSASGGTHGEREALAGSEEGEHDLCDVGGYGVDRAGGVDPAEPWLRAHQREVALAHALVK